MAATLKKNCCVASASTNVARINFYDVSHRPNREESFTFVKIPFSVKLIDQQKISAFDICTRPGNTTIIFDVAAIVKPKCYTCSQGQVLQQNRLDNVAEYSSN